MNVEFDLIRQYSHLFPVPIACVPLRTRRPMGAELVRAGVRARWIVVGETDELAQYQSFAHLVLLLSIVSVRAGGLETERGHRENRLEQRRLISDHRMGK